ncbi:MAG: methyltransferase domain-containing protein [Rhodospirillaceae bacterium]|jgi:2-hydroxy-4-(methylsulfanyl)butanoate S-methyltransferase|nr:methyltransferase domain-containing protein [Rhodospirillaceae bacterium]MBT7646547.1 methyltransferase domain-containing protein [Rhodospirillaceae bacterium]
MSDIGSVFANLADSGEPPLISQLARASWLAGVAKSAVSLGICDKLSGRTETSEWMANELGANLLHTDEMMNSCVSAGLLEKIGDKFKNNAESDTYLVKSKPHYYGEAFTYLSSLGDLFHKVDTAMLSGEEMSHEDEFATEEEESAYWTHYMLAMDQWGGGMQEEMLVENVDLSGKKTMLDVGCGSGVYTMAMCKKYPDLKGVLFDQEKALPLARRLMVERGVADQISILSGDYYKDPLGSGYDAVLFSGALIQEPPEGQIKLLKRAFEAMNSGGIVIVQDILKIGPYTETTPKIALESLVAAVFYGGSGGVVSGDETVEFLDAAGFTSAKQIPLTGVYSIVTAVKP